MPLSSFIKNMQQGVVQFIDQSGTILTIPYEMGDFNATNLKKTLNEEVAFEARGRYIGSGHGARVYPEISFSAAMSELSNTTAGNVVDWLLQRGGYAGVLSTGGNGPRPQMFTIRWRVTGTTYDDDADSVAEFRTCHVQFSLAEDSGGGPTKFSFTATCRGSVYVNGVEAMKQIT